MDGSVISPSIGYIFTGVYLFIGAVILWRGFYQKNPDFAMSFWDVATLIYAGLAISVFVSYLIIFVAFFSAFLYVIPVPFYLMPSSTGLTGQEGLNNAFSGATTLAIIAAVGVVFSFIALKKVRKEKLWSVPLFIIGGFAVITAIINYFYLCGAEAAQSYPFPRACSPWIISFNTASLVFAGVLFLSTVIIYLRSPKNSSIVIEEKTLDAHRVDF
jgi:hypothetical protein